MGSNRRKQGSLSTAKIMSQHWLHEGCCQRCCVGMPLFTLTESLVWVQDAFAGTFISCLGCLGNSNALSLLPFSPSLQIPNPVQMGFSCQTYIAIPLTVVVRAIGRSIVALLAPRVGGRLPGSMIMWQKEDWLSKNDIYPLSPTLLHPFCKSLHLLPLWQTSCFLYLQV